ncbi:MAG: DEAD/DEAH box helicase family protein [Ignavibacteriae bacterium]|nr:DEAD/DEAH box helicase family protein [Ignavibacteriota bacterium]
MSYNEEETKLFLITPKLQQLDWVRSDRISMEYFITVGKVLVQGEGYERGKSKKADYLLKYNNIPIAIIEAKDESHTPADGIQQAKEYAELLDIPFAYSTNGHGIEEFDYSTNKQRTLYNFPSPTELWNRFQKIKNLTSNLEKLFESPYCIDGEKEPRYYQDVAIRISLEAIDAGRNRLLLNLATGTGKTFIAFQICWKLKTCGRAKRILFLADRTVLSEQAYNAFEPFGNARDYINEGDAPTAREMYFSIYQALYAEKDGKRIFQHYPKDFFDLIVIDEAHRSGFGTWMDILNHFSSAIHLGMTATPKESENINTYKYFGNPGNNYQADYVYPMSRGIEDGFLANFVLHRYKLDTEKGIVLEKVIEEGAKVEIPEGVEVREQYGAKEYEMSITLPERTEVMCNKLAEILQQTGEMDKTIVFCVTMDHANEVMKHLQNYFSYLGYSNYAVRIVSEEPSAISLLRTFQDQSTDTPVIATTVDLLSTGFDAPSVKNIVFMKYVNSPLVFKQIVGRGSRISEERGKKFFRIIDFTNATRLIDNWITGDPDVEKDRFGANVLCGYVSNKQTGEPINRARITAQLTPNQQRNGVTDSRGYFKIIELPDGFINITISAYHYYTKVATQKTVVQCQKAFDFELVPKREATPPIKVTGLNILFEEETIFEVEVTGERLTLKEYIDYTKQKVIESYESVEQLRQQWADREKRKTVVEQLQKDGINTEILATAKQQPEADELDLLSNIAFDKEIHTRQERAEALKNLQQQFINSFNDEQKNILLNLLLCYEFKGVDEFYKPAAFNSILGTNGMTKAEKQFGGMENLLGAMKELQQRLYTK